MEAPGMRGSSRLVALGFTVVVVVLLSASSSLLCQQASPQALYDGAGEALDRGEAAEAIRLYEELLQQRPDSMEGRINLGVALAHAGRYEEAEQQYRRVLSRDPKNEMARLNLALALYKRADFGNARSEFEALHEFHPANQQALYLLADCDLRLGKYKDTIALVGPAYEARPDDAALGYLVGTALIKDGQTQKGAAVIDGIMRSGNAALANVLMGAAQYGAGDYKASAETLRKALDANPDLPGAWTLYGRALVSGGDYEGAKAAFQRALQQDPNDFDACLHLGGILRHDGDTENAASYITHALTLRPDSAAAQFQINALEASSGRLEEARKGFETLVKQWPDFVEAHLQLATVYARLHQTGESERERRIVVELNEKARTKGPQPEIP
jgi:tetratricopeptide (TPR) repeat protein